MSIFHTSFNKTVDCPLMTCERSEAVSRLLRDSYVQEYLKNPAAISIDLDTFQNRRSDGNRFNSEISKILVADVAAKLSEELSHYQTDTDEAIKAMKEPGSVGGSALVLGWMIKAEDTLKQMEETIQNHRENRETAQKSATEGHAEGLSGNVKQLLSEEISALASMDKSIQEFKETTKRGK